MIMKSPSIPVLMSGAILLLVFSCATVPTEPLALGEMRLLSMDFPQLEDIRESSPFLVNIRFEADGKPEVVTACFFWSGDGPYCTKIVNVTYGSPGTVKVQLHPRSPGLIALEGYVVYRKNGKTQSSNVVGNRIRIIRPGL
jgi:hypothetical protein